MGTKVVKCFPCIWNTRAQISSITSRNCWLMPDRGLRALLWCVSISPACYGRLMSVFPTDNSPTAWVIPPETNKNTENVTRREWQTTPDVILLKLGFHLLSVLFLLPPRPTLTSFFMHNRSTNDYPISIHRRALSSVLSTSLLPMQNCFFQSHFSHSASLFQSSSNAMLKGSKN